MAGLDNSTVNPNECEFLLFNYGMYEVYTQLSVFVILLTDNNHMLLHSMKQSQVSIALHNIERIHMLMPYY